MDEEFDFTSFNSDDLLNFFGENKTHNFSELATNLSVSNFTFVEPSGVELTLMKVIGILHVYILPLIILVGIVGNTVSFLVYVGTPRLCRQSTSIYLAFLAAVDNISLVFVFVVWFGWVGIHIFHRNGWCQTILYCMYVCSFLSVWTVVSFTCERWIIVFHPLHRHRLCTRKRAIIVMSSLTICALAFYTFSIITTRVQYANGTLPYCSQSPQFKVALQVLSCVDTMATVIIPTIVIIIMNTGIGIRTCRYTNRQNNSQVGLPTSMDEVYSNLSTTHHMTDLRPAQTSAVSAGSQSRVNNLNSNEYRPWRFFTQRQQTQLRITRALLVVSSVFVLLNLPNFVFRVHAFIITVRQESFDISLQAYLWQEFIQFLHYINQSSNLFLYCACSKNFRFALKRLLMRLKRRFVKIRTLFRI